MRLLAPAKLRKQDSSDISVHLEIYELDVMASVYAHVMWSKRFPSHPNILTHPKFGENTSIAQKSELQQCNIPQIPDADPATAASVVLNLLLSIVISDVITPIGSSKGRRGILI